MIECIWCGGCCCVWCSCGVVCSCVADWVLLFFLVVGVVVYCDGGCVLLVVVVCGCGFLLRCCALWEKVMWLLAFGGFGGILVLGLLEEERMCCCGCGAFCCAVYVAEETMLQRRLW